MLLLIAVFVHLSFACAFEDDPVMNEISLTWTNYFLQSLYHLSILPLLILTLIFASFARPSTTEDIPSGFRRFQYSFLSVWIFCVTADWLQGAYVYSLYTSYGYQRQEIAQLFVAGYGSSLAFGCIVGSVADRIGRKKSCLAYCVFCTISCLTKHVRSYYILMFGRIVGGIATSMLFSCFECWLVSEHCSKLGFSNGLLSYMFGLMYTSMYIAAIVAGLVAQYAADSFAFGPIFFDSSIYVGGDCAPFDLSIVCLIIGMTLISSLWQENYGSVARDTSTSVANKFQEACRVFYTDGNVILLCFVVSCFEAAMYAFVFNWTPALDSETIPRPHGVVFALFMMSCLIGASVATIFGQSVKACPRLVCAFLLGIVAFSVLAFVTGHDQLLVAIFASLLLFEFCCGLYFPSVGVLKSEIVPEHVRATIYNIYRVPLNLVVVVLLLSNISMVRSFLLCAVLLTVALLSVVGIASTRHAVDVVSNVSRNPTLQTQLSNCKLDA